MKLNNDELAPIQCICTNVKMASRVIARKYDEAIEDSGVNIIQYSILINVLRYTPIAQITLAEHLDMERTTLYRAVEILEKNGLIKSEYLDSEKVKYLSLTSEGKKVTLMAEKDWKIVHDGIVKKIGLKRFEEFKSVLSDLKDICR